MLSTCIAETAAADSAAPRPTFPPLASLVHASSTSRVTPHGGHQMPAFPSISHSPQMRGLPGHADLAQVHAANLRVLPTGMSPPQMQMHMHMQIAAPLPKLQVSPPFHGMTASAPSPVMPTLREIEFQPLLPSRLTVDCSAPAAATGTGPLPRWRGAAYGSSPSSPASFFGMPDGHKFGLVHLLHAAEQCQPVADQEQGAIASTSVCGKRRLPSTASIGRPHEQEQDVRTDQRPLKQMHMPFAADVHTPRAYPQQAASSPGIIAAESAGGNMEGMGDNIPPKFVWQTVMTTGKFPDDVLLSESNSLFTQSEPDNSQDAVIKQGRWSRGEKEFAEGLIQQVRNGEAVLPPNVSLRKFIADSLQCKTMRVSKKFRGLRSPESPSPRDDDSQQAQDMQDHQREDRAFNPLSLHSIMNTNSIDAGDATTTTNASTAAAPPVQMTTTSQPMVLTSRRTGKSLKRSDYSQHTAVRSGRWSIEEETYAKAMIDAFKAGYLPLHGNVSLRKFLSEVLVCHPMRISKKFVGYVRKYHWYRVAAGQCDTALKRDALERLCSLERAFWASVQQSHEWAALQQQQDPVTGTVSASTSTSSAAL